MSRLLRHGWSAPILVLCVINVDIVHAATQSKFVLYEFSFVYSMLYYLLYFILYTYHKYIVICYLQLSYKMDKERTRYSNFVF